MSAQDSADMNLPKSGHLSAHAVRAPLTPPRSVKGDGSRMSTLESIGGSFRLDERDAESRDADDRSESDHDGLGDSEEGYSTLSDEPDPVVMPAFLAQLRDVESGITFVTAKFQQEIDYIRARMLALDTERLTLQDNAKGLKECAARAKSDRKAYSSAAKAMKSLRQEVDDLVRGVESELVLLERRRAEAQWASQWRQLVLWARDTGDSELEACLLTRDNVARYALVQRLEGNADDAAHVDDDRNYCAEIGRMTGELLGALERHVERATEGTFSEAMRLSLEIMADRLMQSCAVLHE